MSVCISVDCLVYLCCDNKIAGVLIFTNGLFTILAILCNALIFVAVHGLNNFKADFMKALVLFFGVGVFVLCGFEHCVANMFYFTCMGVEFQNTWLFFNYGIEQHLWWDFGVVCAELAKEAKRKSNLTQRLKLFDICIEFNILLR